MPSASSDPQVQYGSVGVITGFCQVLLAVCAYLGHVSMSQLETVVQVGWDTHESRCDGGSLEQKHIPCSLAALQPKKPAADGGADAEGLSRRTRGQARGLASQCVPAGCPDDVKRRPCKRRPRLSVCGVCIAPP